MGEPVSYTVKTTPSSCALMNEMNSVSVFWAARSLLVLLLLGKRLLIAYIHIVCLHIALLNSYFIYCIKQLIKYNNNNNNNNKLLFICTVAQQPQSQLQIENE
jgi:hypothetical protein